MSQTMPSRHGLVFQANCPFLLQNGDTLTELTLAYETWGQLNEDKSNAILIIHALSTHAHVCRHEANDAQGWWEGMVGAGAPINTDEYFVVCANNLGSCFGSTGPLSENPMGDGAYQGNFPNVTLVDMARALALLQAQLRISCFSAIIAPSMGGLIGAAYISLFPKACKGFVSISSGYKSYASNIALRSVAREIIELDPKFNNGFYQPNTPLAGFVLARKLGHLLYRHADHINQQFDGLNTNDKGSILDYLSHNAHKFVAGFDANSFLRLTWAMDHFCFTDAMFEAIECKTHIISVSSDSLFTPHQQKELAKKLQDKGKPVTLSVLDSDYGHDAFLVDTKKMGPLITEYLRELE